MEETDEATHVATQIKTLINRGKRAKDFAILMRINALSRAYEQELLKYNIPYKVYGGFKFFDRKEIKDALAYLHLLANPNDNLRLRRIINEPKRGIGATTMEKVTELANGLGVSLFTVISHADEYPVLQKSAAKLLSFARCIQQVAEDMDKMLPHVILEQILDKSGYLAALALEGEEGNERKENVQELISSMIQYENETDTPSLDDFLDGVSLMTDIDNYNADQDMVVLMTIHAAKGLEFHTVFLVGMEEGIFPGNQSIYASEKDREEERRLMYVGITRAKRKLYLTNA
jgi:DNA helicase-2/ATP-dependent DNA helicase PcrA